MSLDALREHHRMLYNHAGSSLHFRLLLLRVVESQMSLSRPTLSSNVVQAIVA